MANEILFNSYHDSLKKRFFNLFVSFLGLIGFSPVFLLMAIIIKLSSTGSAFFVQERVGKKGKPFKILMFRTMYVGAEKDQKKYAHLNEADGPVLKIRDDRDLRKLVSSLS